MVISYGTTLDSRNKILQKINHEKSLKPFNVIDIGGEAIGWSSQVTDMLVDKNTINSPSSMQLDVCTHSEWQFLLNHVEENGLYDYAICTHTLEDLYNPFISLDFLPKVAKAGIITMPSMRTELSHVENPNWVGFIHHRWMFDVIDNKMLVIPKLEFLSKLVGDSIKVDHNTFDIRYEWDGGIDYEIFMDNYLGPSAPVVIQKYKQLVSKFNKKQL